MIWTALIIGVVAGITFTGSLLALGVLVGFFRRPDGEISNSAKVLDYWERANALAERNTDYNQRQMLAIERMARMTGRDHIYIDMSEMDDALRAHTLKALAEVRHYPPLVRLANARDSVKINPIANPEDILRAVKPIQDNTPPEAPDVPTT